MTQDQAKSQFGHSLRKSYDALSEAERILDAEEFDLLVKVSTIYAGKDFEYFDPEDALTAFARYPDLRDLRAMALRLVVTGP